uniref:Uncharacterized protein n=1 Tax=Chromera velia CCMP2878 TaxID=1169474 RepID=A0A0G4H2E0_9ALVE|eukprot:Cvel_24400.t1-p1 / transcript=Cvel_24400.t1 / gene=Cvel_24400 / organism=Chromera_velia_CCMP2878 / gene_product=hypothetical protein / transcript_product=hypothetical protein / location=Cvel_scaffold2632:15644-17338(-) / protein_length=475 / sequence_SO=supercontig / SO=protein_coding / is_pseudo=false
MSDSLASPFSVEEEGSHRKTRSNLRELVDVKCDVFSADSFRGDRLPHRSTNTETDFDLSPMSQESAALSFRCDHNERGDENEEEEEGNQTEDEEQYEDERMKEEEEEEDTRTEADPCERPYSDKTLPLNCKHPNFYFAFLVQTQAQALQQQQYQQRAGGCTPTPPVALPITPDTMHLQSFYSEAAASPAGMRRLRMLQEWASKVNSRVFSQFGRVLSTVVLSDILGDLYEGTLGGDFLAGGTLGGHGEEIEKEWGERGGEGGTQRRGGERKRDGGNAGRQGVKDPCDSLGRADSQHANARLRGQRRGRDECVIWQGSVAVSDSPSLSVSRRAAEGGVVCESSAGTTPVISVITPTTQDGYVLSGEELDAQLLLSFSSTYRASLSTPTTPLPQIDPRRRHVLGRVWVQVRRILCLVFLDDASFNRVMEEAEKAADPGLAASSSSQNSPPRPPPDASDLLTTCRNPHCVRLSHIMHL